MSKNSNLIRIALEYAQIVLSKYGEQFVFHNLAFITRSVDATMEIGKAEGYRKHEYEMGVVAMVLKDLGTVGHESDALDNGRIIQNFIQQNNLEPLAVELLNKYLFFLKIMEVRVWVSMQSFGMGPIFSFRCRMRLSGCICYE